MCGIAGIYSTQSLPAAGVLEQMNDCIKYRGPDESGYYREGAVGFAHRRLSIVGIETGQQPIFNENHTICVIFNGEIYNYKQLREDIETNHTFTTETDTEVLVHLYEEYGSSFVERLKGMFAFALWDVDAQQLLLARDRMGIKPLLLADDGETMSFASELQPLLSSTVDHGGISEQAVAEYFAFGQIPAPRTIFSNIQKLNPGELVIIDEDGRSHERFYTPNISTQSPSFEEASTELRQQIETAVERRLMSDVELGAFLSGGIDSSIVVGTMSDLMDDPVKTFTVGFEQSLFDESWAAREVAEYHETDHTEFTVTSDEVRETIPAVIGKLGEPFADPSLIPTYVISRETSRDVKVALSGDGADELFAGYSRYRGEYYSKYYRKIPQQLRNNIVAPIINRLEASRSERRGELIRKAQKFLRGGAEDTVDRHFAWNRTLTDGSLTPLEADNSARAGRERLHEAHSNQSIAVTAATDDLSQMLAVDTQFGLPNQILHKTDLASMYNSLEVRVPFLDTNVVEYALSLPTEFKITRNTQKRILKHAFADRLPEAILQRNKQGFDMPIGEWFKDELADEFCETVHRLDTDLLDTQSILKAFEEHQTGNSDHEKFLWSAYVFARWHNRMIDSKVLSPSS